MLILCPATLTLQWQVELADKLGIPSAVWSSTKKLWLDHRGYEIRVADKLGIPSAVWSSTKKLWLDHRGYEIRVRGPEDIARCPSQIAIVSTGLIFHDSEERSHLLERRYGTVILDEAHRARRRGGLGKRENKPNNLLDFMLKVGHRTRHLLLGTATPIQTEVRELWDLLWVLNTGAEFVLGREVFGRWADFERALPLVKGEASPPDEREVWEWIRNPLPPASEHPLFATLRLQIGLSEDRFYTDRGFGSLEYVSQQRLAEALAPGFFGEQNPVVRHTVLRRRRTLEEAGLLERIGVNVHPDPDAPPGTYPGVSLEGLGLVTNHPFDLAYRAAEAFTDSLRQRSKAAGFMKTLLLQRICSSFSSGRATAEKMRRRELLDDDEAPRRMEEILEQLTPEEASHLDTIVDELSRPEARDPKTVAVTHFLSQPSSEGKTWLELGCIIFSQYYDTVRALAAVLAAALPGEAVGIYAGAGRSGVHKDGDFASVEREEIKTAVRRREIRLLVATDAACEGLNLQTLGTMINVDLPWNPSRLEQRLGRIKRFGQRRQTVDMLNLVYHDTQDERVYAALSQRMKDRYDIFGSLPDTIDDDWIDNVEKLEEMMDQYMHLRQKARDAFELRYERRIDPDRDRWELCSRVLARRDIVQKLSMPW